MSSSPSLSPQPPAAPKKSGGKVLLWILGIFCAFIVICVVGFVSLGYYAVHKAKQAGFDTQLMKKNPVLAAAKMAVAANPDVEMVSSNDSAGSIVVRDKRTGKVTSMKFDPQHNTMVVTDEQGRQASITADASSGTLSMQGPDGAVKIGGGADKAPSWVPQYPGSNPQSTFSASDKDKQSGSFTFVTKDELDHVLGYYADALTQAGLAVSRVNSSSAGQIGGIISAQDNNSSRSVLVTIEGATDGTHVNVTFEQKKAI